MLDKLIRTFGPDHPIDVAPHPKRVTVTAAGRTIADTTSALALREASYPAVLYVPRQDVDMDALARSERTTHCPYKGDASYFSIPAAGKSGENVVWTYEAPNEGVAAIKDHLAFYPDRVSIEEH